MHYYHGKHILITGASSGIGAEYARQLAPHAAHLHLAARRQDKLQELQQKLLAQHPALEITLHPIDLDDGAARDRLAKTLFSKKDAPLHLLINNAGCGDYGDLRSAKWERLQTLIELNITALTHLSTLYVQSVQAPAQKDQDRAIIHTSSLAGDLPVPDFGVYAASKAYVSSFSESLRLETLDQNIRIQALCPGPIHTEFGSHARRQQADSESPMKEWFYLPVQEAVRQSLHSLASGTHGKARCYPGWKTRLFGTILPFIPRPLLRALMGTRPRAPQASDAPSSDS